MELQPAVPRFFFDDEMILHQQRLQRRWLPAKIFPKPVLQRDRAWEPRVPALYGTLAPAGQGWRMYYNGWEPAQDGTRAACHVLVAESADGLSWTKPELGVVDWHGSRANNLCFVSTRNTDSPSIVHNPEAGDTPWKMLVFQRIEDAPAWSDSWGLYAYESEDGLRWREGGYCLKAGDRTALMSTLPDGKYVAYTRHPEMATQTGGRAVYRTQSEDFKAWSEPELVLRPDLDDAPDVEFYGMPVFMRHGWYFGLLEYWRAAVDIIEVHLAVSRDGRNWRRTSRTPFIAGRYDWNRAWSTCASNGPIVLNEQMVFYFGGRWTSHHFDSAQRDGAIGYASLPLDRFCALEGTTGGFFDTPPLRWPGGELSLNADTRQSFDSHPLYCNGRIEVEVLDAEGAPLPAWSGSGKATFAGNTHCRCRIDPGIVRWPGGRHMDALRGKAIRLRFHLVHARLFTFTASPQSRMAPG
jgi:hypothetical protein